MAEHKPKAPEVAGEAEWPKLAARMVEDITRSELHRFEANLADAFKSAVDRAVASLILVASGIVGGSCLITAFVLLLGVWLPWWLTFVLAGLVVIGIGEFIYVRHGYPSRRNVS